jgi:predicted regulator of Ras-like GTPase activity (Roadblock/LC7/MglB family)
MSKVDKLEGILTKMITKSHETISSCVVITERGLIVAGIVLDGSSNETLSAMVSLMSDTAVRVCGNLGFGNPRIAQIRTLGAIIIMNEFLVANRRFRMGAVLKDYERFSIIRRRMVVKKRMPLEKIEDLFNMTAQDIRKTLEGTFVLNEIELG